MVRVGLHGFEKNFNPRSHEGSDPEAPVAGGVSQISIHAPTRGATHTQRALSSTFRISIHAPTRGATFDFDYEDCIDEKFQSTLPRGERPKRPTAKAGGYKFQSTLPRGERRGSRTWARQYKSLFQSTLPRGERLYEYVDIYALYVISIHAPTRGATFSATIDRRIGVTFQSTLPRGERPGRNRRGRGRGNFNPRSHEGSDIWENGDLVM